jgi:xanthine dehydrogenase accessory factor
MKRLYREMTRLLQAGESFAVATIFDKVGSAPRGVGAKMLVHADGSIFGSVGGGRLEADAIRLAQDCLRSKRATTLPFDLAGEDAAATDMICGGAGEILIDVIDADDENDRLVVEAATDCLERGRKAWLVTILGDAANSIALRRQQCLIGPDRTLVGKIDCDPYLLEKLVAGPAKISIHAEAFSGQRFLVEPLRPAATIYLFGAGHLSRRIAPLSESVGFHAVVIDDRADYANRERFPEPTEVVRIDSFPNLPALDVDENSYLVIVTRGHLHDRDVLRQVLRSPAVYVGMIGSRRKRDLVFKELAAEGFSEAELGRVFAPIGMNIGAETPEELAVSIVGELIQARAKREGADRRRAGESSGECCRILAPDAI